MDSKCLFPACSRKRQFGCLCNSKIFLCSDHYMKHMKEPGTHREFEIADLPIKIRSATQSLDKNKQQLVNNGGKLITNIKNSIQQACKNANERKNFVNNILKSNSFDEPTESFLENSTIINYEMQDELKQSAIDFFQMLNDKDIQNPSTEKEITQAKYQDNRYKIVYFLIIIDIIIVWLSAISCYLYYLKLILP